MAGQALAGIVQPAAVVGQQIVERQPRGQRRARGPAGFVERHQKGQGADQMGRDALPDAPLAQASRAPARIRNCADSAARHGSAWNCGRWWHGRNRSSRPGPLSARAGAASRAMQAPVTPPPMTSRSKVSSARRVGSRRMNEGSDGGGRPDTLSTTRVRLLSLAPNGRKSKRTRGKCLRPRRTA